MDKIPTLIAEFKTTHNLEFHVGPWRSPFNLGGYHKFKIGTCHGACGSTDSSYDILAITNNAPGNGHFEDVLEWFENSCRLDGKAFRILEVWNPRLAWHLVRERGFECEEGDNYIKNFIMDKIKTDLQAELTKKEIQLSEALLRVKVLKKKISIIKKNILKNG